MTVRVILGTTITLSSLYDDLSNEEITNRIIKLLEKPNHKTVNKQTLSNQIKYCKDSEGFIGFETNRSHAVNDDAIMFVEIIAVFDNADNAVMAKLGL